MKQSSGGHLSAAKILFLCFTTYLTAYLLRTNYSAALPLISEQLSLTEAQLGIVGSVFFLCYASGQLINGFISDAVNPCKFILLALVGTAAVNLAMSFTARLWVLALLWGCNGYFQSIFWGCLQRLLALRCGSIRHSTVASVMSGSMVAGFILSWVVLRGMLHGRAWQGFFLYPAIFGLFMLGIWLVLVHKFPQDTVPGKKFSAASVAASLRLIAGKKLFLLCGVCLCLGFVKESISVWGPTLIARLMGADLRLSSLILLIIPLGNLLGIFAVKVLVDRSSRDKLVILSQLFGVTLLAGGLVALFSGQAAGLTVLMMILISGVSYGCNSILLSMIPLHYTQYGIVSTLIGLFDFSSYLGAAVSSLIAGALIGAGSLKGLALLWTAFSGAALAVLFLARKKILSLR